MQETYLKVWKMADQFDPTIASPITWMVAMARNRAIDIVRRRGDLSIEEEPEALEVAAETPTPLARREMTEELKRLLSCLGKLDPEKQRIVLLAYYSGWSRDEWRRNSIFPSTRSRPGSAAVCSKFASVWAHRKPLRFRCTTTIAMLLPPKCAGNALRGRARTGRGNAVGRSRLAEIVRVWERRLGELNVMVEAVEPPAEVWDRIKSGIEADGTRLPGKGSRFCGAGRKRAADAARAGRRHSARSDGGNDVGAGLLSEPQDLDLTGPPRDLDDQALVSALASSLLPPEPPPEQAKPPPPETAPPKVQRSADIIYLAREARRWRGFTVAMSAIAALLAIYIAVGQFAPGLIPMSRPSPTVVASQTKPSGARLVAVLQQEPPRRHFCSPSNCKAGRSLYAG